MKIDRFNALPRPCNNCPFLNSEKSISHTLAKGRVQGIKQDILSNDFTSFPCHKTLKGEEDDNGEYQTNGKESACMGAMAWLYTQGRFNINMRLAARNKEWLDNLKASALLVVK